LQRRPLRKVSKESSSDVFSSTEADESSTSLGKEEQNGGTVD
jgi:hypothetical protein